MGNFGMLLEKQFTKSHIINSKKNEKNKLRIYQETLHKKLRTNLMY